MRRTLLLLVIGFGLFAVPGLAQEDDVTLPEPVRVELDAADGLTLVGDFYTPPAEMVEEGEPMPGVVLLHMLGQDRSTWAPLLPVLVNDYGFAVLNIDLRGHGETGGERDWVLAEADVEAWLGWLREQAMVDPDAVALVGASIGSNLAIRGWAGDEGITSVVALSPGLDYRGVTTTGAVEAAAGRPVMLAASRDDQYSADSVNQLYDLTTGRAAVHMYEGSLHGTNLFTEEAIADYLLYAIADWVDENMQ